MIRMALTEKQNLPAFVQIKKKKEECPGCCKMLKFFLLSSPSLFQACIKHVTQLFSVLRKTRIEVVRL